MLGILNIILFTASWLVVVIATLPFSPLTAILLPIALLFLMFTGAAKRADRVQRALGETLMDGEALVTSGLQQRVFALWHRRVLVAITTSRVITISRGLLGGFHMRDIQWKDLQDATIRENVLAGLCGSNLSFAHDNPRVARVSVAGVESDAARQIYRRAQAEEQAWEEKRRMRAIEEARAKSGGVTIHSGGAPAHGPASSRIVDEITKAKELLDAGAISDAEYNEMKSRILSTL